MVRSAAIPVKSLDSAIEIIAAKAQRAPPPLRAPAHAPERARAAQVLSEDEKTERAEALKAAHARKKEAEEKVRVQRARLCSRAHVRRWWRRRRLLHPSRRLQRYERLRART